MVIKMSDEKLKRGRPTTGKALTNAQRQRDYRERVQRTASARATDDTGQGSSRLNIWLPTGAAAGIIRMARMSNTTKAAIITKLVTDAENTITHGMTNEQLDAYYIVTR